MDALSHILDSVKLKAVVYKKLQATTSWGIEMAQDSNSQFWRLLKGTCYLRIPGENSIQLKEGDLVFIPHGSTHSISSEPQNTCVPASQYTRALFSGTPLFQGNGEETLMIGGHFEMDSSIQHPFFKSLPKFIHLDNADAAMPLWLQSIASFLREEITNEKAGSKVMLARLADILFILIIRAYIESTTSKKDFLLALKDDKISGSLQAMHEFPEKEWTLEQLATTAGMSRSLYCKEFKKLVGETPLMYLTNWRILKSKEFLTDTKDDIMDVANKVGYQSVAAFTRIFKLKTGETPASFRRRVQSFAKQ